MSRIKGIFISPRGEIRLGWLLLTAAVMYALAAVGVYGMYWRVYNTMMDIWCVTAENVARAPGWVQFLYGWSNVIVQLIESTVLIGFAEALRRMAGVTRERRGVFKNAVRGAALAGGCVVLIWLILMLIGSVRPGWSLSRPAFSVNTVALLLTTFAAAAADGCFFYGALYGMMKKRLPMRAALIAGAVLITLMQGDIQPVAGGNSYIASLVCFMLVERYGLTSAVGFRFAWDYLDRAVFGFAGASAALYETYPVNLYWLSGGNEGIMSGFLTMFILAAAALLLIRRMGSLSLQRLKKKNKSLS